MRRLFTAGFLALAFVVSTSPPAFAFPQDDDPAGVAQVDTHAASVDVEPVGVSLGEPTVELVQAFAPGYVEPLGRVVDRAARIDVPPPDVNAVVVGNWMQCFKSKQVTPSGLAQRRSSGLTANV